jgi:hypothetical protein
VVFFRRLLLPLFSGHSHASMDGKAPAAFSNTFPPNTFVVKQERGPRVAERPGALLRASR